MTGWHPLLSTDPPEVRFFANEVGVGILTPEVKVVSEAVA